MDVSQQNLTPKKVALLNPNAGKNFDDPTPGIIEEAALNPVPEWISGLELFNMMSEKIPTLIGDIIPQEGLVALVGSSDTGKSMMLRQLAVNVVRDSHFLNFPIHARHKSVAIISTEDDSKSLAFLIRRQSEGRPEGLENIHVFFDSENVVEEIDAFLATHKVDAVIADAWGDLFSGNQVDSGQIRQLLNKYKALATKYGCVIIFLHHTGKRTQKLSPSKDNILSGQGFEAKMRLVLELRNDMEDPDYRHLCVVKGNYLGKEYKNASFKVSMDEHSFLFTDTGDRVSFEDLASITDSGKEKKPPVKRADEIDIITHMTNVKEIFNEGEFKLKGTELKARIADVYGKNFGTGFGSDRVQKYYTYLTKVVKLIGKSGKDRSAAAYYFQDC